MFYDGEKLIELLEQKREKRIIRVQSDKDESYYIVTVVWKDPNKIGKRFCSKECADVFYNESMEWLMKKHQEY